MKFTAVVLLPLAALLSSCDGHSVQHVPVQVAHPVASMPSSYDAFGDSITALNIQQIPNPLKWVNVVGSATGWPTLVDHAQGSDQVFEIATQSFSAPTTATGVSVSVIGQNEDWFYENSAGDLYVPFLQAVYVNRLIPDSEKVSGSSATLEGSTIYVATMAYLGSTYQMYIVVDGQSFGPYAIHQCHTTYWGASSSPYVARIHVPSGKHAIEVTTDMAGQQPLWIASNGFARATILVPAYFAGNMYEAIKPAAMYAYLNGINQSVVQALATDGLNIHYVDLFNACVNQDCGDYDGIHPGPIGNPIIAQAFLSAIAADK